MQSSGRLADCEGVEQLRESLQLRLSRLIGSADDRSLLRLVWAVDVAQSGGAPIARSLLPRDFPIGDTEGGLSNDSIIFPWEMETLVNELLFHDKNYHKAVDLTTWDGFYQIVKVLRIIEECDYKIRGDNVNAYFELFGLASRQFEWQNNIPNLSQFYRSLHIFGQGICADYFKRSKNIGIDELVLVGFALSGWFSVSSEFNKIEDLSGLGIGPEVAAAALKVLAAPLEQVRGMAQRERKMSAMIAYRPSVLRRFPCVNIANFGYRIIAPLPRLIFDRITTGLYYDVISGGGAVNSEYGQRFESYSISYIKAMLPNANVESESRYKIGGDNFLTPDIRLSSHEGAEIDLAVECKATRMSFDAKFSDELINDRGYDEIAKGIFQIWRYYSHCRRGIGGRKFSKDGVGLILTLDSWMVLANSIFDDVFSRAEKLALEKDPLIMSEDKIPIGFCSASDLESSLRFGTRETLISAIKVVAKPENRGGFLQRAHEVVAGDVESLRDYPFKDVSSYLPWWDRVAG
ncbi:hypothetical protein [Sphingomonas sp. 22176]|uniref:hypothetical protein n=1 Tax=Sphingomonas sp. 22176 TaxID=3453884 RepID=UPI003F854A0C